MVSRLVIVLGLLFVVWVSGYAQSETAKGNANSNYGGQQSTNASNNSTASKQPESPNPANIATHKDDQQADPFSYKDAIGFTLTFALLLVVVLQAWIAWRQTRIADQQRKIMQSQIDSAETTERAYIGIANMELLITGDEPRLEITWINGGKTPAWHFRCVPSLNIGEEPEPKHYSIPDDDYSHIRNSFIPAGAVRPVSYTELGVVLSNELLAELRGSANKRLYAVMKGTYRDVRWKPREFEYWALYDADWVNPKFIEIESDYEKKHANPS